MRTGSTAPTSTWKWDILLKSGAPGHQLQAGYSNNTDGTFSGSHLRLHNPAVNEAIWAQISGNSLGVVEINDGTLGNFRDLLARNVTAQTGSQTLVLDSSFGGFQALYAGVIRANFSQYGVRMANYCQIGWSSDGSNSNAALDAGIARNAANVVEINNGTVGTFCRPQVAPRSHRTDHTRHRC